MRARLLASAFALFVLGLIVSAQGQVGQIIPQGMLSAPSVGCSQYTTLAARMDGAQNISAVRTLICGMVTDSTYSVLDTLYVFATNSSANYLLNWAQNAFNLTAVSSCCSFTANQGVTGNGTSQYFTSGFNPSTGSPQYALNSSSLGTCVITSRGVAGSLYAMGAFDGTNTTFLQVANTGSFTSTRINTTTGLNETNSNSQGSFIASRTAGTGTSVTIYKNGSSIGAGASNSTAIPTTALYNLAFNNNGTAADWTTDQTAYIFQGGGLTSTQVTNIYNRLHTYLQAVGETTACNLLLFIFFIPAWVPARRRSHA